MKENNKQLYPGKKGFAPDKPIAVGGVLTAQEPVEYNAACKSTKIEVRNTGDRPIQVGSHYHFFEVNRYLEFDRPATFGTHLNIPATTAIRFEPGDSKEVEVVPFGGKQRIIGFNGLVEGYAGEEDAPTYLPNRHRAFMRAHKRGFRSTAECCNHHQDREKCKTTKKE